MSKSALSDILFGEPKGISEFTYKTNAGKEFKVKMGHPTVKDKGWLLNLKKYEDNPSDLFLEVLMRADIRDVESNEKVIDPSLKDSIAASDQNFWIQMAGDWLGILNTVNQDEAIKN